MLDKIKDIVDGIVDFFSGDAVNILGRFMGDTFSNTLHNSAKNVISSEFVANIYQALIPVALIIMFIEFATKLMEMVIDEQVSLDKIIKHFIIMILMMFMLDTGIVIESGSTGGWIIKMYNEVSTAADGLMDVTFSTDKITTLENDFELSFKGEETDEKDKGLLYWITHLDEILEQIIQTIISSITLMLLGLVMELLVAVFALYRAMRLGIYLSVAPVAIAMCYTNSLGAMAYFKKILAIILQEPIVSVTTQVCFFIVSTDTSGATGGIINVLIMSVCLMSNIFASEQKAKELIG